MGLLDFSFCTASNSLATLFLSQKNQSSLITPEIFNRVRSSQESLIGFFPFTTRNINTSNPQSQPYVDGPYTPQRIVGQSGGADFLDCKAGEGKMVKNLTIYADSERVKSIKLTCSDNTTSSTHSYQSGTIHEIRFEPGERVTWVNLWTDDRYKGPGPDPTINNLQQAY